MCCSLGEANRWTVIAFDVILQSISALVINGGGSCGVVLWYSASTRSSGVS